MYFAGTDKDKRTDRDVRFKIHTIYDERSVAKESSIVSAVFQLLEIDEDPNKTEELVELEFHKFITWYMMMCKNDAPFMHAHKAWERGDYYISPQTGHRCKVTVMLKDQEYVL